MDYNQIFAISTAGLNAEKTRLDVAALNLANAHTTAGADGQTYQPRRVVITPVQASFASLVDHAVLPQASVVPTGTEPQSVLDPQHPYANAQGYVQYPGVDTASEMIGVMDAMHAYQGDLAMLSAAHTMALKALDIGGNNS